MVLAPSRYYFLKKELCAETGIRRAKLLNSHSFAFIYLFTIRPYVYSKLYSTNLGKDRSKCNNLMHLAVSFQIPLLATAAVLVGISVKNQQ